MTITAVSALAGAGILAWFVFTPSPGSSSSLLTPDDPAVVEAGAAVYAEHCAACHGADLEGEANWRRPKADGLMPAPPHDETGHTWHHTDDLLFAITKYGLAKVTGQANYRSAMPVYEDILSDDEIIAALSFIKAQWPARLRERHDQMNAMK